MNLARIRLSLVAPLLACIAPLNAHQTWFEQQGHGLTFRYGEYDVNMHEVSPGGLDRFGKLEAQWQGKAGSKPLVLSKQEDRLDLPAGFHPEPGDSLVAIDREYPMFNTARDGKSLRTFWVPATRWIGDFSARKPELPLDIVPTGDRRGDAVEFQLSYLGEPLAGETVTLVTASGWSRKAVSDADGRFAFALPWKGDYVLGIYFIDEASGVRKLAGKPDEPYQLEGYNFALSFPVREGLEPLPTAQKTLPASVLIQQGITPPKHK